MAFSDRTLTCRECGATFPFTASEQEFFANKGFVNEPARCPACRQVRRQARRGSPREMTQVICASCGVTTEVPFKPTGEKPVYCRDCFAAQS